jgi:hypothetical protein
MFHPAARTALFARYMPLLTTDQPFAAWRSDHSQTHKGACTELPTLSRDAKLDVVHDKDQLNFKDKPTSICKTE